MSRICVVGPKGSGKSTAGEFLGKCLNWTHANTSDLLTKEYRRRYPECRKSKDEIRDVLYDIGEEMRLANGSSTLMQSLSAEIVSGVRAPEEIDYAANNYAVILWVMNEKITVEDDSTMKYSMEYVAQACMLSGAAFIVIPNPTDDEDLMFEALRVIVDEILEEEEPLCEKTY